MVVISPEDEIYTNFPIDRGSWFFKQLKTGEIKNDNEYNISESSLAYEGDDGLIIITGCSHVGLENIIERAKTITGINTIKTIIGGFHSFSTSSRTFKFFLNIIDT